MAYDEKLAGRVRELICQTHTITEEKKMFGGLCFMVDNKMCIGVESERIMVRFDPAVSDTVLEKEGCHPMDFTGRIMKGYVFVDANAVNTNSRLNYWVQLALAYNQFAKVSRKKKQSK